MIVRVSPEQSNLCMVRRVEHDPHWFSEKIMLKSKRQSWMAIRRKVITL
jgi:hypothetical protein